MSFQRLAGALKETFVSERGKGKAPLPKERPVGGLGCKGFLAQVAEKEPSGRLGELHAAAGPKAAPRTGLAAGEMVRGVLTKPQPWEQGPWGGVSAGSQGVGPHEIPAHGGAQGSPGAFCLLAMAGVPPPSSVLVAAGRPRLLSSRETRGASPECRRPPCLQQALFSQHRKKMRVGGLWRGCVSPCHPETSQVSTSALSGAQTKLVVRAGWPGDNGQGSLVEL